jgi:hypothetical protein
MREDFYEIEARARKVQALVHTLAQARNGQGFTADEVREFTDGQWALLTEAAAEHYPTNMAYPSRLTRRMVIAAMEGVDYARAQEQTNA